MILNINVIREFGLESSDERLISKISKAGKKYTIQGVEQDSLLREPSDLCILFFGIWFLLFT